MHSSATQPSSCLLPFDEVRQRRLPLYLGVDVGRTRDLTVLWLLERVEGMLYTRRLECLQDMAFSEQEGVLYQYLALPSLRRACIDASGLGRQLAERAAERYGAHRVEGISLTAQAKEELAFPVRAAFEDGRIRIPRDPELRADLRQVRKEVTASGTIRFAAERTGHGHADRFWALAFALHAARESAHHSFAYSAFTTSTRRW